jgi:hypothetical protein
LRKILEGFNPELYPVAIRAKAMKCLAQIVEADYQVLMIVSIIYSRYDSSSIISEILA